MASGQRICRLIGEWLRVGFCQGNFNADNCLVGGRTMDYGRVVPPPTFSSQRFSSNYSTHIDDWSVDLPGLSAFGAKCCCCERKPVCVK